MSRTVLVFCLLGLIALASARGMGGRRGGSSGERGPPPRGGRRPPPPPPEEEGTGEEAAAQGQSQQEAGAGGSGAGRQGRPKGGPKDGPRGGSHEEGDRPGPPRGPPLREFVCKVTFDGVDPPADRPEPRYRNCTGGCTLFTTQPGPEGEGTVTFYFCDDKDEQGNYLIADKVCYISKNNVVVKDECTDTIQGTDSNTVLKINRPPPRRPPPEDDGTDSAPAPAPVEP